MCLQQNQTLRSASGPLRGDVCGLVRKLFEKDGSRRVGDLSASSFPELKPFWHWYPIQFRPTVSNDKLHLSRPHEASDEILVKLPDTLAV